MSGPGLARTRKSVEALMEQMLVVKVSRETYARRGVAKEAGPTPAQPAPGYCAREGPI